MTNLIVGAAEPAGCPLRDERADHHELDAGDADVVPDDCVRIVDAKLRESAGAQHRHALPALILGVGEHAADVEVVLSHDEIVGRRADDRDVRVAVVPDDLAILVLLRLDRRQVQPARLDGVDIGHRDLLRDLELDAALRDARRVDLQRGRAQLGESVFHRLLRAAAERHHGNHGGDADDDAEHREERAQFVRPQRRQRDEENLESHCFDSLERVAVDR